MLVTASQAQVQVQAQAQAQVQAQAQLDGGTHGTLSRGECGSWKTPS